MTSWLKKNERILKNTLGGLFLVGITWEYFQNHSYYAVQADTVKALLAILVGWALVMAVFFGVRHFNGKKHMVMTPLRLFALAFVLIWMTGVSLFTYLDAAVVTAPVQMFISDQGEVSLAELNDPLIYGVVPQLKQGTIVRDWTETKEFLPVDLHPLFTYLNPLEFGGGLFLKLAKQFAHWGFLTLMFLGLGSTLLRVKEFTAWRLLQSVGVGMATVMAALFLVGVVGGLSTISAWIIAGVALAVGAPQNLKAGRWLIAQKVSFEFKQYPKWTWLAAGILGVTLSLNTIDSIIPMSLGFDSIALYHNTPKLMTQYGALVPGLNPYNYGLIMSLPLFLFGSNVASVGTVVYGFMLAIATGLLLLRKIFKAPQIILAMALFISLPMVNFMLHIDLKTDLPLLFFQFLAMGQMVQWDRARAEGKDTQKDLLLTGLWLGIGLGIKYTTFYLVAPLLAFMALRQISQRRWRNQVVISIGLVTLGVLGFMGFAQWVESFSSLQQTLILGSLIGLGAGLIAHVLSHQKITRSLGLAWAKIGGVMVLCLLPWLTYNAVQAETISLDDIFFGEDYHVRIQPEQFGLGDASCELGQSYDEIGRYTGNFDGHSLLIPFVAIWESSVNHAYADNRLVDVGPYFLGFAVFVLLAYPALRRKKEEIWKTVGPVLSLYTLLWALTGTGIIWFAFSLVAGLIVLYVRAWKDESWTLAAVLLMMTLSVLFRVQDSVSRSESLLFAGGVTSEDVYLEQGTDGTVAFRDIVNDPSVLDKYVYAVGGFLKSDIQYNDRRYFSDQFMEYYECYFTEGSAEDILKRLKVANFEFLILTQTALGVEADTTGPVHQRYIALKMFADQYMITELANQDMILYRIP
jgi:hypothetical protein